MSSRATYNVPYDSSERDRRKKAFIRKRKRKRLLVILSLFAVALGLLVLIVCLTVGLIKKLIRDHDEKMAYVEYTGEYADVWLVDNSNTGRNGQALFYEIEDTPEDNTAADTITPDPKAEKYKDIIPGSKGLVIVDAGHGGYDGGAEANGVLEKDLNLEISYKLKDELILRGYTVYLSRTTNNVDISNAKRAEMANSSGAEIFIRLEAPAANDPSASGVLGFIATSTNSHTGHMYQKNYELCYDVLKTTCEGTGATRMGIYETDNLTALNYCNMPATVISMGFLSNESDDIALSTDEYKKKLAVGIAEGIDLYFAESN